MSILIPVQPLKAPLRSVVVWGWLFFSLLQGQAQVSSDDETIPTRILFVFDASNSMNAIWGGQRKIQTATNLLSETLEQLHTSDDLELALRVYGHGTKHIVGEQDCDDTELVVPFHNSNNLIIKQALGRIRAQGTTPIARSLELAAEDFPNSSGRNVIILITDGIEACDQDPCAVSRALQSKNITVKPFVIGMGIDDEMALGLRCIGNFYDAADADAFEHVLQLVLEQALHNTTVHIDLLDGEGQPTVTNVGYSFTDIRTNEHDPQYLHTLRWGTSPDTLYIDPLPTYALTVHCLPPVVLEEVTLQPGKHNVVTVPDMGMGSLRPQFARGVRTDYGTFNVRWHVAEACTSFFESPLGMSLELRTGTYDLVFPTVPPTIVENVTVREGKHDLVEIKPPGTLMLTSAAGGYAVVVDQHSLSSVMHFEPGDISGRYTLQPGDYTLIFRARNARGTLYSLREHFNIKSGMTTNLKLHG